MKPKTISVRIRESDYEILTETSQIFEIKIVDAVEAIVYLWESMSLEEQSLHLKRIQQH